jgi:hypothetical protein
MGQSWACCPAGERGKRGGAGLEEGAPGSQPAGARGVAAWFGRRRKKGGRKRRKKKKEKREKEKEKRRKRNRKKRRKIEKRFRKLGEIPRKN